MDDAARRKEEAEALAAIFGSDFVEVSDNTWQIHCAAAEADMTMCLPDDYPSCSPPTFTLDIPRCGDLRKLAQELICLFTPGEEVAYQCVEHFLAICASVMSTAESVSAAVVVVEFGVAESRPCASKEPDRKADEKVRKMAKAERKAEEKARKLLEAQILENMTFDEEESLLDGYGNAHAAGVEDGWLHI